MPAASIESLGQFRKISSRSREPAGVLAKSSRKGPRQANRLLGFLHQDPAYKIVHQRRSRENLGVLISVVPHYALRIPPGMASGLFDLANVPRLSHAAPWPFDPMWPDAIGSTLPGSGSQVAIAPVRESSREPRVQQ